jgi:hypothetical protein
MKMVTPDERLARMRKCFEKDRHILTADYKYFTTPDKRVKQRKLSIVGGHFPITLRGCP